MSNNKTPKISIGITSMAVILTVLCLTVFSVLTLSTALSEREFSEKRSSAAKAYYAAEVECTTIVNAFGVLWKDGADRAALASFATEKGVQLTEENGAYLISFERQIDAGQLLSIEVRLGESFEVLRWQVVSNAEWTPDTTINVWDGEMIEFE